MHKSYIIQCMPGAWHIPRSKKHLTRDKLEHSPRFLIACVLTALLTVAESSKAEFTPGLSLRATTNYVIRGYTRSNEQPAAQLNLDLGHSSGFFFGSWISSVAFSEEDAESGPGSNMSSMGSEMQETVDNPAHIEFQPYAGFNAALTRNWRAELISTGYIYNGTVMGGNYDYAEIYSRLLYKDIVSMRLGIAPNSYGYDLTNVNFDAQVRYPLTDVIEFSAGLGYDHYSIVSEYSIIHWNAGVQWNIGNHVALELRYFGRHTMVNTHGDDMLHAPPALGFPIVFAVSVGF